MPGDLGTTEAEAGPQQNNSKCSQVEARRWHHVGLAKPISCPCWVAQGHALFSPYSPTAVQGGETQHGILSAQVALWPKLRQ